MSRSRKTIVVGIALASTFSVYSKKNDRPNIVLIFADDLGWTDLKCTGSDFYETPSIDSLRSKGVLFTRAYSNAANSAPTRASLMTGLYSPRHGVYTVNPPERGKASERKLIPYKNKAELPTSFVLLPRLLKSAGYRTIHIGKWHLGSEENATGPLSHGFDVNIGGGSEGTPRSYFSPYQSHNGIAHYNLPPGEDGEYLTDRLTSEAIDQIYKSNDAPFFLYLAHHAVHTPLQAKPELIDKYKKKQPGNRHYNPIYAAMVESLDQSVGRIVNALRESNQLDNTLIVFTSDNGGMLNRISDNSPLRGGKGNPYEGGNRVPLIMVWKDKIVEGCTNSTPVMSADFLPTFIDLAGVKTKHETDGVSLTPLIDPATNGSIERPLFFFFPAYLENYATTPGFRATPYSSVIKGDWKLIHFFEDDRDELYNIAQDVGETTDLTSSNSTKQKELRQLLNKWLIEVNAPITFQKNPLYQQL